MMSGVALTLGLLLLALADEDSFNVFVPASILIGIGGAFAMMNSLPAVFIVQPSHMSFVATGYNCLFDASSVMFLVLYQLYARFALSRQTILIGYAALCVIVHAIFVTSWAIGPSQRLKAVKTAEERGTEPGTCDTPPLHGLPLQRQLKTFEFAFALVFTSLQMFRSNMYLGLNKELLQDLGDAETNFAYSQIFALSLPASTVFVPLISWCLRRRGFADTFLLITILGFVYNLVAVVPILEFQPLAFAAFTFFRAVLFSAHFTYIAHTFGSCNVGKIHGLISIVAAGLNFTIWPATVFAAGNLLWIFAPSLGLCLPPFVLSLLLRKRLLLQPVSDCRVVDKPAKHGTMCQESPVKFESEPLSECEFECEI